MSEAGDRHGSAYWLKLKDRALSVALEGIAIADARLPDRPLIYVNEGFVRLTGYSADEVLGRNCRFLQGETSDPDTVETIRRALHEGRDCTVEILNFRKDGSQFWNRLSITPVHGDAGEVTHFIAVQSDVTARREAEDALRRANEQMRRDLQEAAMIQTAWLPQSLPSVEGFEFAWRFRPCTELSGDSLNVLRLDERTIGLYILDVCGHGVPAALLSASLNRWLSPVPEQSCLFESDPSRASGVAPATPAKVLDTLNHLYHPGPETGKFFTILYGVLDLQDRSFRYGTAGHPPPVRIDAAGAHVCPLAKGLPIGVLPDFEYGERVIGLEPGDRLLVYTDGVLEAIDADDRELGEQRLLDALAAGRHLPAAECLTDMIRKVEAWCPGGKPQDDISMLSLDVVAPEGRAGA